MDAIRLHTTTTKVEAVLKAPPPGNIQELRSFLGLVHYYGEFLPNISHLMNPLATSDGHKWVWTKECVEAFKAAKELLVTAPVLAHYDPSLPIKLARNASAYGLGAFISYVFQDGKERQVAFVSRTQLTSEQNYSQLEEEALFLIFGIQKFHNYLYGGKFTLITDHKPLTTVLGLLLWQLHASNIGPYSSLPIHMTSNSNVLKTTQMQMTYPDYLKEIVNLQLPNRPLRLVKFKHYH